MNQLDDLLSSAGRVPDITQDGLRNARAALGTAIAQAAVRPDAVTPGQDQKRAGHWPGGLLSGWRGRTLAGVTAVAAAAAAFAAVTAAPTTTTGAPAAGSPPEPTVKVSGRASATPKPSSFRTGFSAPTSSATAAQLLDEAAAAAGTQPGWPDASYWYTESADTSVLTGATSYSANWSDRHGNGVTASGSTPIPRQSARLHGSSGLPAGSKAVSAIPVVGDSAPFYGYTWAQLYALPTGDTAALESYLMTAGDIHFGQKAPGVQGSWTGQEDLFNLITNLLSGTPAPPALREALYKVAATIPGVTVKGTYTDSLGRTGTALQLGPMTAVIDPATGQYLDGMMGLLAGEVNCSKVTGRCQATDPATGKIEKGVTENGPYSSMLITQGPAAGLPEIVG
jgi:hypothetical protein